MRYCPYCRRISAGRPQICNYCGRTWYIRLCPRGHENPPDAQFCSSCGSTDLTETAGIKYWWIFFPRIFIWSILILFILSLIKHIEQFLPQFISLLLPLIILLTVYFMAGSMAPWPIKSLFGYINKKFKTVASIFLTWIWNTIRKY